MIKIICFIFIVLFMSLDVWAHSGGTNAEGCHTNRKTGDYHCHNKKLKSQKIEIAGGTSELDNQRDSSNEKRSGPQNNHRIFQWVDEKGEVHYSKEINDLPNNANESKNYE
jgi:phosphosulfolactate synthase (CoM biosynthesis protein A)